MNPLPDDRMLLRISEVQEMGISICNALLAECVKLGFALDELQRPDFYALNFQLKRDPYSQQDSLEGTWLGGQRQRVGTLIVHANNSFFAEFDVIKPHPGKPAWFVEAVTAWGQGMHVMTEARLLQAV